MDYNDKMRYTTGNDANILLAHLFSYEINTDEGMKKKIFWHKRVIHHNNEPAKVTIFCEMAR